MSKYKSASNKCSVKSSRDICWTKTAILIVSFFFFHSTGSIVLAVLRTLWTLVLSGLFFSFLLTPLSESSLSLSFPDCFHAAFSPVLSVLLSPQPRDITTRLEPRELRHLLSLSRSSFHFSVNLKSLWPDRILST